METPADSPLPPLREDLTISRGAPLLSGAPSWVIHDPIRHRFFQISQRTIDMISFWSAGTVDALRQKLHSERALEIDRSEVESLVRFLRTHALIAVSSAGTAQRLQQTAASARGSLWQWAAHRYVFFRVPLVRPHGFLSATWPVVAPLFSRSFVVITLLLLALALYLVSRQWADVQSHFHTAFTPPGAATYAVALFMVKLVHELGHAYQAVSRGLRVPVMGVAFLVMFPLLYTDVTDAWRLRKRRDRIMIDAGGVTAELTAAVYATLLWCFLPDGALRNLAFALATTSWVLSLLINLNPFMRFDGYYLLADAIGVSNLQARSFAFGKWMLRRALFGLAQPPPEGVSRRMRLFMIAYAYLVWIYRFFLFLGIALLVYAFFFKALGVLLFAVEIAVFIVKPILNELKVWVSLRQQIVQSRHSLITLAILAGLVALAFWPVGWRIQAPAIVELSAQQRVFAPVPAELTALQVSEGDHVVAGAPIALLTDPELTLHIAKATVRIKLLEERLLSVAGDDVTRASRLMIGSQIDEERELLSSLQDQRNDLIVTASIAGRVQEVATDLEPGVWVDQQRPLALIVGNGGFNARGLIEETDRDRLDASVPAVFIADNAALPILELDALHLSDFAVESLPNGYWAASNGGPIVTATQDDSKLIPRDVWYPLLGTVKQSSANIPAINDSAIRGKIIARSQPISFAARIGQQIARVLIRELSF